MKYKDWLNEWLTFYVQPMVKSRTYKKYKSQTELHIVPLLGDFELNELTASVLQKFTAEIVKTLSPNTVNGILSVIKSSLKKAVALGYADKEYTNFIVRPKIREKKTECLTLQEQRKIESYVQNSKDKKLFGVVFCLYTGLRIGELLALTWEDIDLNKGIVTVSKTCTDGWQNGKYVKIPETPKTENSNRTIPIPKQLIAKIKQLKKTSGCKYFVCGRGEYGSQVRSYQKTFERLLKKLKITHKSFHSLRHTFATRALECGMDIKTLSEILGHKNPTVTLNRYAHSLMEHKKDMMNKLGKLFSGT